MAKNKLARLIVCFFLFAIPVLSRAQTDCSQYNHVYGPFEHSGYDVKQHATGGHDWDVDLGGSCSYSGSANPYTVTQCGVVSQADPDGSLYTADVGTHSGIYVAYTHYFSDATKSGVASAGGGSITSDSEAAVAVQSCLMSCGTNIGISGSGQGGGFSVSFSPTPLWSDTDHSTQGCIAESLPAECTPTQAPPYPGSGGGSWVWDYGTCSWVWESCTPTTCPGGGGSSPVVIDTLNTGFVFTDPTLGNYVTFDLHGDGNYGHFSWPQAGSGNAWLVYDRDGDGIIKDGTELFGNFTPHSDGGISNRPEKDKNGFLALAWYDKPAQGGNGDLILDKEDAIWKKLRLWIDGHCYKTPTVACQSLPTELYTLESKGVLSLSLVYGGSPGKMDVNGNEYRFYAVVNPEIHDAPLNQNGEHADKDGSPCCDLHQKSKDGRLMYDVFLRVVP